MRILTIAKNTMIKKEELIEKFLAYVAEHKEAIHLGDHVKANKIHKRLHGLYNTAKEASLSNIFEELLNDKDENVRLWAATFTLKISSGIAEKTLQELAGLKNIIGLNARTTLELWKQGLLNLL